MAQPVPLEITPRNRQAELRNRLERAHDDNAEPLLAAYELLHEMHEQGVLELARGMLSAQDEILTTLARDAGTPTALQSVRNLVVCQRALGKIGPDRLRVIFEGIPEGIAQATAKRKEPVTIFSLLRRLMSRESLRAIAATLDLLECVGRRLLSAENNMPASQTTSEEKA